MLKKELYPIVVAMALVVVASNILVQFVVGNWLTYGAFTYPFAFLITDLTNRFYGKRAAQKVVLMGFLIGIICSFIGSQIIGEYGPLVTQRIAIASALAFFIAQSIDVAIFDKLRSTIWWKAPLASSFIGAAIDTLVFFVVAFSMTLQFIEPSNDISWAIEKVNLLGIGPELPFWVSLALADFGIKLCLVCFSLFPFRWFIGSRQFL